MTFQNPYAWRRSEERLVEPSHDLPHASSLPSGDAYECPNCSCSLRLAKGKKVPPYFAHVDNPDSCTEWNVLQRTAALLIVQVIKDYAAGRGGPPEILRRCARCHRFLDQPIPASVASARDTRGTGGPDVELLDEAGTVVLGIYVRVLRPAGAPMGPWIEVLGREVLANPLRWRPVEWGELEQITHCAKCEEEIARIAALPPAAPPPVNPLNPYFASGASLANKVFGAGGMLSKVIPGYEQREGQIQLAEAIDQAIKRGTNLMGEGPCGTGKSAAYLSIAMSHVAHTGGRVIVSTANKALMDQIYDKDIPSVMKALDLDLKYTLIKGRSNYLCDTRMEVWVKNTGDEDHPVVAWAQTNKHGDLERYKGELPYKVRRSVCGTSDCASSCKEEVCFYQKAKIRAKEAQVVVTNHAMLFANLALKSKLGKSVVLPEADIIVMDEGHEAADQARGFFEFTLTEGQAKRAGYTEEESQRLDFAEERFFEAARQATRKTGGNLVEKNLNGQNLACENFLEEAEENFKACQAAFERACLDMADDKTIEELSKAMEKASALRLRVKAVCDLADDVEAGSPRAFWLESRGPRKGDVIHACPVEVGRFLHENLFSDRSSSVIVTSATLSTSGNFDHIGKELGFVGDMVQVQSPFDFDRQSILVVPDSHDMPHDPRGAGRERFLDRSVELFEWIAQQTGGGVLFLFASKKSLERVRRRARIPFRLLAQGDQGWTTKRLAEEFKNDENSCLLGLKSFWAGLDVPGHGLRCVIVEKLPFLSPDDPFQSYRQRVHGKKVAMDYMLQDAMLQLRQGVGRLVRRSTDGGAVVMLDRRVMARYSREFQASMPWSHCHQGLGIIQTYFRGAAV